MVDKKNDSADKARSGYIAGLRALADFLDAHPEIKLPITRGLHFSPRTREEMAAVVALMHEAKEATTGEWHRVDGKVHGLPIFAMAPGNRIGGRQITRRVASYQIEPFVTSSVPA